MAMLSPRARDGGGVQRSTRSGAVPVVQRKEDAGAESDAGTPVVAMGGGGRGGEAGADAGGSGPESGKTAGGDGGGDAPSPIIAAIEAWVVGPYAGGTGETNARVEGLAAKTSAGGAASASGGASAGGGGGGGGERGAAGRPEGDETGAGAGGGEQPPSNVRPEAPPMPVQARSALDSGPSKQVTLGRRDAPSGGASGSGMIVQRAVNPSAPAFAGWPQTDLGLAEVEGGEMVSVPEPIPQGFKAAKGNLSEAQAYMTAVVASRAGLDAAIADKGAAVDAALAADLSQGRGLERADRELMRNYSGSMGSYYNEVTNANLAAQDAAGLGDELIGIQLQEADEGEEKEKAEAAAAMAKGDWAVGAIVGIINTVKSGIMGGTPAAIQAAGTKLVGSLFATGKKALDWDKLVSVEQLFGKVSAVKAKWASKRLEITPRNVTSFQAQIGGLQQQIEAAKSRVDQAKSEAQRHYRDAMDRLTEIEQGEFKSITVDAVKDFLAVVRPAGDIHRANAERARNAAEPSGWEYWATEFVVYAGRQRMLADMMVPSGDKLSADGPQAYSGGGVPDADVRLVHGEVAKIEALASWSQSVTAWLRAQYYALGEEVFFATGPHLTKANQAISALHSLQAKAGTKPAE